MKMPNTISIITVVTKELDATSVKNKKVIDAEQMPVPPAKCIIDDALESTSTTYHINFLSFPNHKQIINLSR